MEFRLTDRFRELIHDKNTQDPLSNSSFNRMSDLSFLIDMDTETYMSGLGERVSRHF